MARTCLAIDAALRKFHASFNVSDLPRSIAFYRALLGVEPAKVRADYAKFDLAEPALNLTMQVAPRTGVNASHFGVQVASTADVLEAKQRFERAGLATFTEEQVACCYAVQDKVWVEDPDGNAWEVFVVKGEAEVMTEPGATPGGVPTTSDGCCVPAGAGSSAPKKSGCC
jgi:catechol 2,3-dioxygenase-like lactoylglutathione lyase family enzyme